MKWVTILFIIISLTISSCSEYEKVLKSTDIQYKYDKAFEYYDKKDYVKASALLQYLTPIYKATDKGDKVEFYYAKSLYEQGDYILGGYEFSEFVKNYANSEFIEEAEFYNAYCYYKLSPRPSLDQANTMQAINSFMIFITNFPNSNRIAECNKLLNELNNKLITKSYASAKLYYDLQDYKAAIVALKNTLSDFPNSTYREDIMFLILKSNYLLALNSIPSKQKERFQDTIDEYYSFTEEFSDSKYLKEAQKIYNNANGFVK